MSENAKSPHDYLEENIRRLLETNEPELTMPPVVRATIAAELEARCPIKRGPAQGATGRRRGLVRTAVFSAIAATAVTAFAGWILLSSPDSEKVRPEPDELSKCTKAAVPQGQASHLKKKADSSPRAKSVTNQRRPGAQAPNHAYAHPDKGRPRFPHTDIPSSAGIKRPEDFLLSVDTTWSVQVARATNTAIVRARFVKFSDTNQTCWKVTKLIHGPLKPAHVVSFNSMRIGDKELDPRELTERKLTRELLMRAHFGDALKGGWSPENEVILLIAGTATKGTDGSYLSCEGKRFDDFSQYHFSGVIYGHLEDLDAVEKEIHEMIRTGSHVRALEEFNRGR
jgi:hypothetical protein